MIGDDRGDGSSDDTLAAEDGPETVPTLVVASRPSSPVSRYKLGEVLGTGGMGEVVSARDEQIGRSVAIKRMRSTAPSSEAMARFLREAQIQGRLQHPAVVPVHELWRDDRGLPFFVMKQLSGVPLAEVIAKLAAGDAATARQFTRQRLLRAFVDVCLAVEFAHTHGVVHRDLKPANIVLGEFGEVYVLDWGIARVVGDAPERASFADIATLDTGGTVEGTTLGTPGYMSPEQVRGDADLDGRADVYALGCMLYEILAHWPLHPRGRDAMASAVAGVDARPSRRPEVEVPPELDAACVRACATNRSDRFATARELGDVVQQFLDGDRDVALRKNLARAELDAARAALASTPPDRRAASRAAARALALDPTERNAADLVARLMLEPPAETPREVEDELEAIDLGAQYATRRLVAMAGVAYLVFFAILYWVGFRDPVYMIAGVALAATVGSLGMLNTPRHTVVASRISFAGNVLLVALVARLVSPFFAAPGLAVIIAMSVGTHPRIARPVVLFGSLTLAVLAPWALEHWGVLSQSTFIVGDSIRLRTVADHLEPIPTQIALVVYVVALLAMAVLLARSLTDERRAAQRAVQIQAWQLRQLVPQTG